MQSQEFNNNNEIVEVDGICFETLVSQKVLTLPRKDIIKKFKFFLESLSPLVRFHEPLPGVQIQFGIGITNQTPKPLHFYFNGYFLPDILRKNEVIEWEGFSLRPEAGLVKLFLALPGERIVFFRDINLFWLWGNQYGLSILFKQSSHFICQPLDPGEYQVRFTYVNHLESLSQYDSVTKNITLIENVWLGEVSTPWLNIEFLKFKNI